MEHQSIGVGNVCLYLIGNALLVYYVRVDATVLDRVTTSNDVWWHIL